MNYESFLKGFSDDEATQLFLAFMRRCIKNGWILREDIEDLQKYDFSGKIIELNIYEMISPWTRGSEFLPLHAEMLCQSIQHISAIRGIRITSSLPGSVHRAIGQHLSQIKCLHFHALFYSRAENADFMLALSQMHQLEAVFIQSIDPVADYFLIGIRDVLASSCGHALRHFSIVGGMIEPPQMLAFFRVFPNLMSIRVSLRGATTQNIFDVFALLATFPDLRTAFLKGVHLSESFLMSPETIERAQQIFGQHVHLEHLFIFDTLNNLSKLGKCIVKSIESRLISIASVVFDIDDPNNLFSGLTPELRLMVWDGMF